MRFIAKTSILALTTLALATATAEAQRTYVSHRIVGTGTADLSLTTDGTVGTLSAINFTDWVITVSSGGDTFTLLGPLSGANSHLNIAGPALSATTTDLLFNFGLGVYSYALFQGNGSSAFYCLDISGCGLLGESLMATVNYALADVTNTPQAGVQTIASVTTVPEPSTWALVLPGLLALVRLRRRREHVVKAAK